MTYYIYQLSDPRDGKPFYIGKGKGSRIDAHEKEAKKGRCSRKCDRIREIWGAGLEIQKKVLKRFSDEATAYQAEANLIASIGLESLTNVVPGGGYVRAIGKKDDSGWSGFKLNMYAPSLARTLRWLDEGKRLFLFRQDMTESWERFFNSLVKKFGEQAIIDAVKPHGVELVLRRG